MYWNLNAESLGVSGRQNELIELALTYRFKGVDLDVVHFGKQADLRGLDYARRLIDSARIRIGGFDLPVRWRQGDTEFYEDLKRLERWAGYAAAVGAKGCVTEVLPASDERPYHENFEFHRTRFTQIADALVPHGVRLGLSFRAAAHHRQGCQFQFIASPDALLTLMKTIACPNVGICVDLWNWHLGGGSLDQIRALGADRIVAVRLADVPKNVTADNITEQQRLLPGSTGVTPAAALVQLLKELKYDGPVTPYGHPRQMASMTRNESVQRAAEAMGRVFHPERAAAAVEKGSEREETDRPAVATT